MVDLNNLRDLVLENQDLGKTQPSAQDKKIFVSREGKIVDQSTAGSTQVLSEVRQDTFASRIDVDRERVRKFLPLGTRELTTKEGVVGWLYEIRCELGQPFQMFVHFDGANYQVRVISPELEDHWKSPHTGHIFSDGRICFGTDFGNGQPSIQEAFAKSVLWATGISLAIHGKCPFPFSANNRSDAA